MRPAPPALDPRRYDDILAAALARIPVHTPEWTNFNRSDPGVTLLELFAFIAESVAYRADQVPERNRARALQLLGVPRAPGASARGVVQFSNPNAPDPVTLTGGLEVRAGAVPFQTELGLDVLPVEGHSFVKRKLAAPSQRLRDYHRQLYASYQPELLPTPSELTLYETVPLDAATGGVALQSTVDLSVWIALAVSKERGGDPAAREQTRHAMAGRTLSLGVVPALVEPRARLIPGGGVTLAAAPARLEYRLPVAAGPLPVAGGVPAPAYAALDAAATVDVLSEPGVVQLMLPADSAALSTWENLDPLESGVGDLPPALEDSALEARVVTWLRITAPRGSSAAVLWTGINAAMVSQRVHVTSEPLPPGTGEADQEVALARTPVVPGSARILVEESGRTDEWRQVDDLLTAGPEVPAPDPRDAPGVVTPPPPPAEVFALDPASGRVTFGDGLRGRRPPRGARLRASYDQGLGAAGNVGPVAITLAPGLPEGFRVSNPVRTWGGAEPESVAEGERHAARFLQHRDRLVSVEDFEAVARRTPGIELGRVEVLPTFNPELLPSAPGDAAGAVTLLVVPQRDPVHADSPEPDETVLAAVCRHLEPRRLVTTEIFVRGPDYVGLWVSIGIETVPGTSFAVVRASLEAAVRRFLAPVDLDAAWAGGDPAGGEPVPQGWPLAKPVVRLELMAVAGRVPGVRLVRDVQLARGGDSPVEAVELRGLELPRLLGLSVTEGPPREIGALRGARSDTDGTVPMPVPVVPETC